MCEQSVDLVKGRASLLGVVAVTANAEAMERPAAREVIAHLPDATIFAHDCDQGCSELLG